MQLQAVCQESVAKRRGAETAETPVHLQAVCQEERLNLERKWSSSLASTSVPSSSSLPAPALPWAASEDAAHPAQTQPRPRGRRKLEQQPALRRAESRRASRALPRCEYRSLQARCLHATS